MSYQNLQKEIPESAVKGAAGFLGGIAVIFLLPRLVRFAVRNYVFRVIAEIIAIVTLGLLTDKFTKWVARHEVVELPQNGNPVVEAPPPPVGEPVA